MDTEYWPQADSRLNELDRQLDAARALAGASNHLSQLDPALSARTGLTPDQRAGGWGALGATLVLLAHDAAGLAATVALLISFVFVGVVSLRLAAAIAARIDRNRAPDQQRSLPDHDLPSLTALVPLYDEANMADVLVSALSRLDYPTDRLEILLLVEFDDAATIAAFRDFNLPAHFRIIAVPPGAPRTKPRALNYGLSFSTGELVVVFDAEDRPHPDQPRAAAAMFRSAASDLAVVQAPLLAHNPRSSWIASQFALEYAIHFRVWLPFLARMKAPLALGGTSNYFRGLR